MPRVIGGGRTRKTPRTQSANPDLTRNLPAARGRLKLVANGEIEKMLAIVDELIAAMDVTKKTNARLPVHLENTAASAVGTRRFQRHLAAVAQRFAAMGQTVQPRMQCPTIIRASQELTEFG